MTARPASPFYAAFGRRLQEMRKRAGMTQMQFSIAIGMSRVMVANLERGRAVVYLDRLPVYAKVLGCRIADLLPPQWRLRT